MGDCVYIYMYDMCIFVYIIYIYVCVCVCVFFVVSEVILDQLISTENDINVSQCTSTTIILETRSFSKFPQSRVQHIAWKANEKRMRKAKSTLHLRPLCKP